MFDFRFNVLQMILSLLMSAISGVLIEQRWKAAFALIAVGAAAIIILSVAIRIARRIQGESKPRTTVKKSKARRKTRTRHAKRKAA
jgi:undecaprenyl pyrophosphate phosphatase UppP